jgi:hypothetical protein
LGNGIIIIVIVDNIARGDATIAQNRAHLAVLLGCFWMAVTVAVELRCADIFMV